MIAFDGEEASQKAVTMIARNANALKNLECHMVYVSDKQAASSQETIFDNAVQELIDAGIEVQQKKLSGHVVNALCSYQEHQGIDFTVMGAFGHSRLRDFFMGSITNDMLLQAKKPLLMLR
jgi:nucleotide-binding universal stress UspA family protein